MNNNFPSPSNRILALASPTGDKHDEGDIGGGLRRNSSYFDVDGVNSNVTSTSATLEEIASSPIKKHRSSVAATFGSQPELGIYTLPKEIIESTQSAENAGIPNSVIESWLRNYESEKALYNSFSVFAETKLSQLKHFDKTLGEI